MPLGRVKRPFLATIRALLVRFGYHLKRSLGTKRIDHGIWASEIMFPRKRGVLFGFAPSSPTAVRFLWAPIANEALTLEIVFLIVEVAVDAQAARCHFFGNRFGLFVFVVKRMVGGNLKCLIPQH